jgi:uncharacterized protein YqeY
MTLKEKIDADFIAAFKAKETEKKNFLGVIKGEIQTASGRADYKGEDTVLAIVKKMEKSLNEINTESSKLELSYLAPYLPTLMSEEEVRSIVSKLIVDGKSNLGLIMKEFSTTYKGLADNKIVSQITKELLCQ